MLIPHPKRTYGNHPRFHDRKKVSSQSRLGKVCKKRDSFSALPETLDVTPQVRSHTPPKIWHWLWSNRETLLRRRKLWCCHLLERNGPPAHACRDLSQSNLRSNSNKEKCGDLNKDTQMSFGPKACWSKRGFVALRLVSKGTGMQGPFVTSLYEIHLRETRSTITCRTFPLETSAHCSPRNYFTLKRFTSQIEWIKPKEDTRRDHHHSECWRRLVHLGSASYQTSILNMSPWIQHVGQWPMSVHFFLGLLPTGHCSS